MVTVSNGRVLEFFSELAGNGFSISSGPIAGLGMTPSFKLCASPSNSTGSSRSLVRCDGLDGKDGYLLTIRSMTLFCLVYGI